jgi:hypothetical protein
MCACDTVCVRRVHVPTEAIMTPSPTKNMLHILAHVKLSTPNRQLVVKTATGADACKHN